MRKTWKLLEPIEVGKKTFRNRIVMAPMETRLSNPDGSSTKAMADYYENFAKKGVAAIIVENSFVDGKASRSSLVSSGIHNDHMIGSHYLVAEAIKSHGSVAILQLSHGGRQAVAGATGLPPRAPSAVTCNVIQRDPEPLSIEEIIEIEDAFAAAAVRAQSAGFDGVEIHGAHGYLICSFLSAHTNKRDDEYGGSLENRGRFPRNIAKKIRAATGPDFLVGYRISGAEFLDEGLTIEETCSFSATIQEYVDYIHVSAGNYETMAVCMITSMYFPQAPLVPLASAMKKAVNIPVIAVGALDAELGEKALCDGDADVIAYGRALLADPALPMKLMEGKAEDIRPCCRGHEGCISLFFRGCPIRCEVNPQAGRESDYQIEKVSNPKKIVVVGGGMAGMEAARFASEIGHNVTLFEKSDRFGGHYAEGTAPSFKTEGRRLLEWLIRQVEKSGTDIRMNTLADAKAIAALKPDVVITAVGSDYDKLPIPGIEKALLPDVVLWDPEKAGKNVVVIGGGLVGAETALHLAKNGKNVTIIEMLSGIALEAEPLSQVGLNIQLEKSGVVSLTGCRVTEVFDDSVVCVDESGVTERIMADSVITATALIANRKEAAKFADAAPQVFEIGDCVQGRKIYECFHEAWHAVRSIR